MDGGGSYPSGSFTTTAAGTYRFVAVYSGDANYLSVTFLCAVAEESVVVTARTPTPTATPTAGTQPLIAPPATGAGPSNGPAAVAVIAGLAAIALAVFMPRRGRKND